jgi:ribosome-associated translation inhibitor RaiA
MRQGPDLPAVLDVEVTTHGQLPGAEDYARTKIGELGRLTHQPVPHAHVRLSEHGDPAVARRVIAQANLDVSGRLVRAQVEGVTAREAIDRLEARLRHRLERSAEHWEAKRGGIPRLVRTNGGTSPSPQAIAHATGFSEALVLSQNGRTRLHSRTQLALFGPLPASSHQPGNPERHS